MVFILYALTVLAAAHIIIVWLAAVRRGRAAAARSQPAAQAAPGNWPFVSVLIPAWRERGAIEHCLRSLRQVDYPDWEVIVVAGGPDGTYQAASEGCAGIARAQVIEQLPRGKNAALNEGLRLAQGDVIALLDADSLVGPQWLRELVAPISAATPVTTGDPAPLRWTFVSLGERMEQIAARAIHGDVILQGSGSIALRRDVIQALGGFPEDVAVGVDWDLNARLAARGIPRIFCPQAIVVTERPATLREYWANEVRWRRGHLGALLRAPKQPMLILAQLYIYGLAWFSMAYTCATVAVAFLAAGDMRAAVIALWAIFTLWIFLRRAALAGEVAAYRMERRWLRLAWVPPLLLGLTLAAIIPATVTLKRAGIHFQGPRNKMRGNHAH